MKVLITGVSGFAQEAIAESLVELLADTPSIEVVISREEIVLQPKPVPAIQPVKKAAAKKAAKPAKPVAAKSEEGVWTLL